MAVDGPELASFDQLIARGSSEGGNHPELRVSLRQDIHCKTLHHRHAAGASISLEIVMATGVANSTRRATQQNLSILGSKNISVSRNTQLSV
ncbi:hypothetical protein [Bradyrhizobium septentrionale]|uniref:Uncharacterized protein n=1 Tax=Bradyrhizobium septentrionale TaxID=1404411 RepID=A0A974A4Y7_9BRAD|nr:hypothetical protein [Bradyrhizobium septentrionale]UGY17422.1 hypothetical protein HAP48_0008375 [Bradyrhizobium septentrionale]UGY26163.1 hypothetical protein HU675_0005090 [Bradyrhizobium septentrionale]